MFYGAARADAQRHSVLDVLQCCLRCGAFAIIELNLRSPVFRSRKANARYVAGIPLFAANMGSNNKLKLLLFLASNLSLLLSAFFLAFTLSAFFLGFLLGLFSWLRLAFFLGFFSLFLPLRLASFSCLALAFS